MPCIFCIAVFAALAGQVTAAVVDQLNERLQRKAKGPVRRTSDTESVTKMELVVEAAGKDVPVAVTVFKPAKRVRIQVLDHSLSREEAEKLQNQLADVMDLRVVERSDPESEAKVREAHDHADRAAERDRGREPEAGERAKPERGEREDGKRRWLPFGRR
jgi:hypothetical protein